MHPRLIPTLLALSLLSACAGPTQTSPLTRPAAFAADVEALGQDQLRVLVEGEFTLPSQLVSVGSGGLVSVGSGQLVSVGSGNLVSVGTGNYAILATDLQPVAKAAVALVDPQGQDVGVDGVQTDQSGQYRMVGKARPGVYMVTATLGEHRYRSLTALRLDMAVKAPVDVATTLVTAKLLAGKKAIEVLPASAYIETVEEVRRVLVTEGLPLGWTPDQAEATMGRLERKYVVLQKRLADLAAEQARLEQRLQELEYKIQALSSQLEVSSQRLSQDLRAVLSQNPSASDEEVTATVSARQTSSKGSGKSSNKPAPAATATPVPSPTPTPVAAPSATPAPVATPTPQPSFDPLRPTLGGGAQKPTSPWFPTFPTPQPTAEAPAATPAPEQETPAENKDKDKDNGKDHNPGQGNANGHDKQPASVVEKGKGAFGGLPGQAEAGEKTDRPVKLPWLKK